MSITDQCSISNPMIQSSCGGKNGKLNETIEVSALWSNYCVVALADSTADSAANPLRIGLWVRAFKFEKINLDVICA